MMDAGAVVWKEWRELFGQGGLRGKQGIVLFVVTFGILLAADERPRLDQLPGGRRSVVLGADVSRDDSHRRRVCR